MEVAKQLISRGCPMDHQDDVVRHTVRNLHFLSKKFNFDFLRKLSIFLGEKPRENVVVLGFLAVDNFDFTRKIAKNNLGEKLVKMLGFLSKLNFRTKI